MIAGRLNFVAVVLLGLALASQSMSAADDGGIVYDDGADISEGGVAEVRVGGVDVSVADLEQAAASTGTRYIGLPQPNFFQGDPEENLGWCMRTTWQVLGDRDPDTVRAAAFETYRMLYQQEASGRGIGLGQVDWYQPCDVDPAEALPIEVVEAAIRDVALAQMPRPTLEVPPGWGLAGLRMFLVTGHDLTFGPETVQIDVAGFQLEVTFDAVGVSTVDWGDGTVTTHDAPGLPYPNGEVTHVWTDAGPYDVTVTDRWTIDYDVAGTLSGTIEGTLDEVTLGGFEVRERRAVRTR